ncbi:hypothetical protein DMH08_31695 [Actinomadura sp. WAC 06369]|nr:hypothetical protein DMH08_31695 [Actinomadura sp. WAC 06369]
MARAASGVRRPVRRPGRAVPPQDGGDDAQVGGGEGRHDEPPVVHRAAAAGQKDDRGAGAAVAADGEPGPAGRRDADDPRVSSRLRGKPGGPAGPGRVPGAGNGAPVPGGQRR